MKRITILLTAVLLLGAVIGVRASAQENAAASSGLDALREAFVQTALTSYSTSEENTWKFIEYSEYGSGNDVLLMQLYMSVLLPDGEVNRLLDAFDLESGSWKDIDYASQDRGKWQSTLHMTRLYALTKLYAAEDSPWKGSERLGAVIHAGLGFWFRTDPVSLNWWHNEIGVPRKLGTIMLMIRDELTDGEMESGLRILERAKFGMTGQNRTWLAGNNLLRGLLIDDKALVLEARYIIAEEICVSEGEGIRDDWSFHQHGAQLQFGNYGLAYADGIALWLRVFAGTRYQFDEEKAGIFSNFFREGLCWCVYRGVFDPSASGRQNFLNAGRGKAYALAVAARNMAVAEPSEADFYNGVADSILDPDRENALVGARYYGRSDFGIYRAPAWYSSVRMHSERTIGFEFTNRENTLGNFSADGAVLLMQDADEYENIFACWDWRKVPGVTAYDDGGPIKSDDSPEAKRNDSAHVGGTVAETSAGTVMAATMELSRDGLHTLKSAFYFSDCIIELGSDITSANPDFKEVTTAVDQTHLCGDVTYGDAVAGRPDDELSGTDAEMGVQWVHHNNRGYVSLDGAGMKVSEAVQKGKWDWIDPAYHDRWDETPVFKCWFDHTAALGETGS
ncbi:MAG: sugar lyase, partial [Bacteroidales bacterium]|nr:sugar lyase [Bacteroidales bacterium]